MSKRDEIRRFIQRRSFNALAQRVATMQNREHAESIRLSMESLSHAVAFEIADEYTFLELADIMEWRKTRVKR